MPLTSPGSLQNGTDQTVSIPEIHLHDPPRTGQVHRLFLPILGPRRGDGASPRLARRLRELKIGGGKIVPQAQQRLARELDDGVSHTVAEVQIGTVSAFAVDDEGI